MSASSLQEYPMTLDQRMQEEPEGLVSRAYRFAEKAHKDDKRTTGEPYFNHVRATAETLAEYGMDDTTIAAGLLHDTVEDTSVTLDQIKKEFGNDVAFIVDGVTKLGHIKYRRKDERAGKRRDTPSDRAKRRSAETFRKMFIALSKDLRVVFVRLADRLHNMQTLSPLRPDKRERIARETDEIYAPLALRLGMYELYGDLRDLAFPYLHPEEYRWLKRTAKPLYEEKSKYIKKFQPVVLRSLKEHGLQPTEIKFRAKRISSLYAKLILHGMDMDKIYDLVAVRLIMETVADCYAALGAIHQTWPPLPGRVKDYIAMPKPNGYRSLHTTVIGPDKQIVEFQIRTREMDEEAELGIAAHWAYKHKTSSSETKELSWVKELQKWQSTYRASGTEPDEFLESVKVDFFKDRIFTITPKGEVFDLPAGATPVDFAYHVHSDIGNQCVGARVNQKIVPLDHELRSGDLVEILIQKGKKPSENWLDFVKTNSAKDHIRRALRKRTHKLRNYTPTKSQIKIVAKDRVGLMRDIADVITRSHTNIVHASVRTQEQSGFSTHKLLCDTADPQKLDKIVMKFKKMKEVKEVGYQLL